MAENKRIQLIDAAIDVIRENGFEATSVSQIVQKAGVAQGTFYLYFQTKNELIPSIAERVFDEQLSRIQVDVANEPDSIDDLLEPLINITYDVTAEYRELITFIYSGLAFYHSFVRWEMIYTPYYDWLKEKYAFLQEKGKLHQDIPLDYLANYTVGFIEHAAESYYLSNTLSENAKESKKQCYTFLRKALHE